MPRVSRLKAAYHIAREKWQERNDRAYKNRNVRVLPNPVHQSRESIPDSRPPDTLIAQRKIAQRNAALRSVTPQLHQPDSLTLEETESNVDIDETVETPYTVPKKTISDEHPLAYFGLDTKQSSSPQWHQHSLQTITEKLETHLQLLKEDARLLKRTDITLHIEFIEDALSKSTPDVILEHIEQSPLKSLGAFQAAYDYLIYGQTSTPKPAFSTTHAPRTVEDVQRDTLKSFNGSQVNILVGDITKLKDVHGLPVEGIVYPFGELAHTSKAKQQIQEAEPFLKDDALEKKLKQLQGGSASMSPASELKSQGAQHIIYQILPRSGESETKERLIYSYLSAMGRAREKGLQTIALPVVNPGIPPEQACAFALRAVSYCQNHPETGHAAPKVYFTFPNDKQNRDMYRAMDQLLAGQLLPEVNESSTSTERLPKLAIPPSDTLKLIGKILPTRHGFRFKLTAKQKVKWMNNEIHQVCTLMSQGKCSHARFEKINTYVENAYSHMLDQILEEQIPVQHLKGLQNYFERQLQLLELFKRKQDRIKTHQQFARKASSNVENSAFPLCPVPVKQAMVQEFDHYSNQVLHRYYLKPMAGSGAVANEKPIGKIPRPYNGIANAGRTAVWVKALIHLYQKHGDEVAVKIQEEDIPLIQMAAIYDGCARRDEGENLWESESVEACRLKLMEDGVDAQTAQQIAAAIKGKNKPLSEHKDIIEKVLHDAVALDTMRRKQMFNIEELNFTRQFQDQQIATEDIESMTKEVLRTIHRQHDLSLPITLKNGKKTLTVQPVQPSFDIKKKEVWELSQQPYSDIEEDLETHSPFIARLLIDETSLT